MKIFSHRKFSMQTLILIKKQSWLYKYDIFLLHMRRVLTVFDIIRRFMQELLPVTNVLCLSLCFSCLSRPQLWSGGDTCVKYLIMPKTGKTHHMLIRKTSYLCDQDCFLSKYSLWSLCQCYRSMEWSYFSCRHFSLISKNICSLLLIFWT